LRITYTLIITLLLIFTLTACSPAAEYSGETRDNLPHGSGTITYPNGTYYRGQFVDGARTGFGIWQHPDNISYTGNWLDDLYHGHGRLEINGNLTYEGQWRHGRKHGYGIQEWADGRRYEGTWYNGFRHGTGTMHYPDGSKYDGQWDRGRKNGEGVLHQADGEVLRGLWENDQFVYIPVETVALTESEIFFTLGDEPKEIGAVILPIEASDSSIFWESSAPDIALVEEGTIIPLSTGEAVISVSTPDGPEAECLVRIVPPRVYVTGISLDRLWANLSLNSEPMRLQATIEPANATNKSVIWSSSDPTVASVSTTGLVTPMQTGETIITVRTADGDYTEECRVTVRSF